MEYQNLVFEVKGKVACIVLNRPQSLNSINMQMKHELEDAVSRIEVLQRRYQHHAAARAE